MFGRCGNFNICCQYAYQDGSCKNFLIPKQEKANTFSGSLQFGVQFNLFKHIAVGLQLLGVLYGKLSGNATGISDQCTMSAEDQQSLKDEMEELSPYIIKKIISDGCTGK